MRVMIWAEALSINAKCPEKFHTLVYLYTYSSDSPEIQGTQTFYSRLLRDVKAGMEDDILLIPIAVNTNVSSVDLALKKYHITKFPAILIDQKIIITEPPTVSELEHLILNNSN